MPRLFLYAVLMILFILVRVINDLAFRISVFPDLLFIMSVYIALSAGRNYGQVFGFILGLISDTFGSYAFGASALMWTVIGFFTGYFRIYIEQSNVFSAFLLAVFLNIVYLFGCKAINGVFNVSGISYFGIRDILRVFINGISFMILLRFLNTFEDNLTSGHNVDY